MHEWHLFVHSWQNFPFKNYSCIRGKLFYSEFYLILNYQRIFLFLHTFLLLTITKKYTYLFTTNLIE